MIVIAALVRGRRGLGFMIIVVIVIVMVVMIMMIVVAMIAVPVVSAVISATAAIVGRTGIVIGGTGIVVAAGVSTGGVAFTVAIAGIDTAGEHQAKTNHGNNERETEEGIHGRGFRR